MMKGLIFSKDRAMQLDATLSSFFFHAQDADFIRLTVLYSASTTLHQEQYERLKQEYIGRVEFVPEFNFQQQVFEILLSDLPANIQRYYRFIQKLGLFVPRSVLLKRLSSSCVLFLVDDNIFVRSFNLEKVFNLLSANPDALGFSLRLGTNTVFCYAQNKFQTLPEFVSVSDGVLKYRWTRADGDFGYPLEVSSSIYFTESILDLLTGAKYKNPNTLEFKMARSEKKFRMKSPTLLCLEKSVTFCTPINVVQDVYQNRAGSDNTLSPDRLAELFTLGKRINTLAFVGFTPQACHQEVQLTFEDRD